MSSTPNIAFAYRAQSAAGEPIFGTIDAANHADAMRQLESLGVRVLSLAPPISTKLESRTGSGRPIRGQDFLSFNQQLAHLAAAGLPIEQGLRLIAQDMRTARLGSTIHQIADELDRGVSLGEAFDKHRSRFPSLYGRLIDAGVKTNNLPGMLLNLGGHVAMVERMRTIIWRSISYPLMVGIAFLAVLSFISRFVVPKFEEIFIGFGTELPDHESRAIRCAIDADNSIIVVVAGIAAIVTSLLIRGSRSGPWLTDHVVMRIPLIGPAMKRNRIARWCDALKLAVDAGLDLPAGIELAGHAAGSPRQQDGENLSRTILSGQSIDQYQRLNILPATIPAAISLAIHRGQLAEMLATLSEMYQRQAENRIDLIPIVLTPALLALLGVMIGFVILALFAPMISITSAVSGG